MSYLRKSRLGWRAAALLVLASSAEAGTWYVSPGTAWKTLQHAADVVGPGDTVIALPGTHVGFNLFSSGAPGAPITFTGNPGVAAPNPAVLGAPEP